MVKTIVFAVILIFLSLVGLSIGLLLTGKSKLKKGCKPPIDSKDKNCDKGSCETCRPSKKNKS